MAFDPRNPPRRTVLDDDGQPHEYTLTPFGSSEGWKLATELFALVGPPLGKLLGGVIEKGAAGLLDANVDLGVVMGDLTHSLLGSTPLVRSLLRNVTRDRQLLDNPAIFELAYQANYGELAEVLAWVIEVNGFVRFFTRLLTKAGGAANLLASLPSRSQPGPSSSSGDSTSASS